MTKSTNKVLSVILAVLMALSCMSIAFAADEQKNDFSYTARGISEFVSNAQSVTYLANMLDDVLKEQQVKLEIGDEVAQALKDVSTLAYAAVDLLPIGKKLFNLTIDLTSIDASMQTMDDLYDIWTGGTVKTIKRFADLGDIEKFKFDKENWKTGLRRKDGDQKVFEALVNLIATNTEIIKKVASGTFSLGAFNDLLVDEETGKSLLDFDFHTMLIEALASSVYPDAADEKYQAALKKSADDIIFDDLLPTLVTGEDGALAGLTVKKNDTLDQLMVAVFNLCWKEYLVPLLEKLDYTIESDNGLATAFNDLITLDFYNEETQTSTFNGNYEFNTSDSFLDQVNDLLGFVIDQIVLGDAFTWEKGGFDKIGENVRALFKYLIKNGNFAGTPYEAEANAVKNTDDFDAIALITVKVILSEFGGDFAKEALQNAKTLKEMAFVALKEIVDKNLKLNITYPAGSDYLDVAADLLAYVSDMIVPLPANLQPGAGAELEDVIDYVATFYQFDRGFAKMLNLDVKKTDSGYRKLNSLLWIFYSDATPEAKRFDIEALLVGKGSTKGIFESILTLDVQNILNLTFKKLMDNLDGYSASKAIYSIVRNVLNNLLGANLIVAYKEPSPFDNALSNANIANMAGNLIAAIGANKSALISTGCYLACDLMDIPADDWTITSGEVYADGTYTVKLTGTEPDGKTKINRVLTSGKDFTVDGTTIKGIKSYEGKYYGVSFTEQKAPAAAGSVKATAKNGAASATITWSASSGATGYIVSDGSKQVADITATSYTVSGLKANTAYANYTVTAYKKTPNGKVFKAAAAKVPSFTTAPAAPATPKASKNTTSSVVITWAKVAGASKYVLEQYNASKKKWASVYSDSKLTYTVSKLSANTAYKFRVTAVNSKGVKSAASKECSTRTLPGAVKGLKASSITSTSLKLTWTKVTGATSYQVYNATTKKVVGTVTTNSITVKKLSANKAYKFQVLAIVKDSTGTYKGAYSSALTATTLFTKTNGLKATKATASEITVTWTKVKSATTYQVYVNGKLYTTVKTNKAVIKKRTAGTTYSIYVVALKSKTKGEASATIKVAAAPAKVTSLKASSTKLLGKKTVTITWKAAKGATSYNIYQGSKKIGTSTKPTYKVSKLDAKTTYTFAVEPVLKAANYTSIGAKATVKG